MLSNPKITIEIVLALGLWVTDQKRGGSKNSLYYNVYVTNKSSTTEIILK